MGVRILYDSDNEMAALYCSTTGLAFGQLFYAEDKHCVDARTMADQFLDWHKQKYGVDVRQLDQSELDARQDEFTLLVEEQGEFWEVDPEPEDDDEQGANHDLRT